MTNAPSTEPGEPELPRALRAAVYWRSLALQACWNPQRMQNLGLLVSLTPWARHHRFDAQEGRRFCRRYFDFFNTNPYLANFLIGGLLRLEETLDRHQPDREEQIRTFKNSLAQSFASLGDQLFWLGLQPTLLLACCLLGWLVWPPLAVAPVLLFGIFQLMLRWHALSVGYRLGLDMVDLLARPIWHRAIKLAMRTGMVLAGFLVGCHLAGLVGPRRESWLYLVIGLGLPLLLRQRLAGEGLLLVALALALVVACL